FAEALGGEGRPPAQHFISDHAQTVDVRAQIHFFPAKLFRAHIGRRAQRLSFALRLPDQFFGDLLAGRDSGEAKIEELDLRLSLVRRLNDSDAPRLQIAVDKPGLV